MFKKLCIIYLYLKKYFTGIPSPNVRYKVNSTYPFIANSIIPKTVHRTPRTTSVICF